VLLAQQDEDVDIVIIPNVPTSLILEQLNIKEYKERKQDIAQYGSYGLAGNPVSSPVLATIFANKHASQMTDGFLIAWMLIAINGYGL
jgi:hypothetical protein